MPTLLATTWYRCGFKIDVEAVLKKMVDSD
jgi:hypothetical protein